MTQSTDKKQRLTITPGTLADTTGPMAVSDCSYPTCGCAWPREECPYNKAPVSASASPIAPPDVADILRTVDLRAGYIIGACKDVNEMRLEAEEIKRLLDRATKGMYAWWHGPHAADVSHVAPLNAIPEGQRSSSAVALTNGSPFQAAPGANPAGDAAGGEWDRHGQAELLREFAESIQTDRPDSAIPDALRSIADTLAAAPSSTVPRDLVDRLKLAERIAAGCKPDATAQQVAMYAIDIISSLSAIASLDRPCERYGNKCPTPLACNKRGECSA